MDCSCECAKPATSCDNVSVMNYDRFLNAVGLARKPDPIRVIACLIFRAPPSLISLAGGLPNACSFPFIEAEFKLRDATVMKLNEKQMQTAQQYGATQGTTDLLQWLKAILIRLHNPPTANKCPEHGGLDIGVTFGSMDGVCKCFEMLVSPGDNVLVAYPCHPSLLAVVKPIGCKVLPVETDQNGILVESLLEQLSGWRPEDAKRSDSDIPRLLYVMPNGANPTGATLTIERRKEIYQIAREYNLLIIENDPYYFLQYEEEAVPSFLSMDVDGRVIRVDSFSMILSPGLRVGFISGPQPFVSRLLFHMMASVQHVPTISQVIISQLLDTWGIEGFLHHIKNVKIFYKEQKGLMIKAAAEWLSADLAEWLEPIAGIFLWLRLNGIKDSKKLLEGSVLDGEVHLVPGSAFLLDTDERSPFVRASFASATSEDMDLTFQRLSSLVREEQDRQLTEFK